ncbi:hypothetical protein TRFO_28971 [Tritrichomonas foetus]|uniref:TOG domain-containing protein n=1 Tax=Tritrichomonas foetus TaxID=1144522 RepID=A0A1J4JY37_9EUKA|nr:hypothetical protein TRFO_28971 [Tritrichomonas foetus]|eukprot:OHT03602.1 hypothetical protein TRFO_28971 [Tritrichomonas foetus]
MTNSFSQNSRTNDISQLISSLFDSAGDNIEPVIIQNEILASKEVSNLIAGFQNSKDWDDQLAVIQKALSLVKGNACSFQNFVSQLPNLVPELGGCILNSRSTLVKYSCLLISQLAKNLRDRFENVADAVLPILFQPTSTGTQIIANSCRYAIFAIIQNCQSKKVLSSVIDHCSSQSHIQRNISVEGLKFILIEWSRNILLPYFKQLEKSIYELLSDSNFDVRNNARLASSQLMKLFPDRNSILYPTIANTSSNNSSNTGLNGLNNKSKNDFSFPSKSMNSYSKDFSNTISFSYDPPKQKKVNQSSTNKGELSQAEKNPQNNNSHNNYPTKPANNSFNNSLNSSLNNSFNNSLNNSAELKNGSKQYVSNIPVKKRSLSFQVDSEQHKNNKYNEDNESQTITFSFEPKTYASNQSISMISKPKDEAQTVSFIYDPSAKATTSSFSKDRPKSNNNNLSVHFASKENDQHNKKEKTIELSSSSYFTTSLGSFNIKNFECVEGNENEFLDTIRTTIATKQNVYIEDYAESITDGFLVCLQSPIEQIQVSTLNLFVDIIKIIPNAFESNLEMFVRSIIDKADKQKSKTSVNASTALRAISSNFPSDKLLEIAIKCPISDALLSFVANLVRIDESALYNDEIAASLLPICCKVYETTKEQRFSALSVGLLNKINEMNSKVFVAFANSVDDQWTQLLRSLYLEPNDSSAYQKSKNNDSSMTFNKSTESQSNNASHDLKEQTKLKQKPARVLTSVAQYKASNNPESKLEDLLRQLTVEKSKNIVFNQLISFFNDTNAEYIDSSIPKLVKFIHSGYSDQVVKCIDSIASIEKGSNSSNLLDAAIDFMKSDTSTKSIDFLTCVVQHYKSRDISPRLQELMSLIKPLLEDSHALMRKSTILLIVSLRKSIGKVFDGEINKLPNISKKMVHYYLLKNHDKSA